MRLFTSLQRAFKRAVVLGGTFVLGLAPVNAQTVDPQQLAALLMVQAAANGVDLTISDAARVGDDVVLKKVQIGDGDASTLAEVRLQNVRALPGGGYRIGRLAMPAAVVAFADGKVTSGAWSLSEILVPPAEDKTTFAFYSEKYEAEPMRITDKAGNTVVEFGRTVWTSSPFVAGQTLTTKLEPIDIVIDPASATGSTPDAVRKVVPSTVRLQVSGDGTWRDTDGRSVMSMAMVVREVGKLRVNLDLSGLTVARFHDLQKAIVGLQPGSIDAQSSNSVAALMELGQVVKLHGLAIRFDDASLTGKLLDDNAKKSRLTRAQYVAQLKATVPLLASMLGDPRVSAQATTAVSAYLDNPQSLELKLQPQQPASIMEIGLLAMTAPQAIAERLVPQITANK